MMGSYSVQRTAYSVLMMVLIVLSAHSPAAEAASFSSKDLIENAKLLDGKVLTYKGEAITAIMDRGAFSWMNVFDGYNAIGIWCKSDLLKDIKFLGDYKHKGDVVEIEGVFSRACPSHNGELDIHALKVNIVERGYRVEERVDKRKINLAVIIFLLTLLMVYIFRKKI